MNAMLSEEERLVIRQRLAIGLGGLCVFACGFGLSWVWPSQAQVGQLFCAFAALVVGFACVVRGLKGLFHPQAKNATDQMVALAAVGAFVLGDFLTAILIPLILDIGRLFEERSAMGARAARDDFIRLQTFKAIKLEGDKEVEVNVDDLKCTDRIIVRPGERIPTDGRIVSGRTAIDQSAMTGEARPENKKVGDTVLSGTKNISGSIQIEVTAVAKDSALGRVIDLLSQAQRSQTPQIRRIEMWLSNLLPISISAALIVLYWTEDPHRAITVLVAACPTALALAGPATLVAAITAAAKHQIVIKDPSLLERMDDITIVALDKTGTLTYGQAEVESAHPTPEVTEDLLLMYAALCGRGSLHPVSRSILRAALQIGLEIPSPQESTEYPGRGVSALWEHQTFRLGQLDWLKEEGVSTDDATPNLSVYVSQDSRLIGGFLLGDRLREGVEKTLHALTDLGFDETILVTGDRQEEADRIASLLSLDLVIAEMLPEDKAKWVGQKQAESGPLMMVGDGINDALAMNTASVGVAIGSGLSHAALDAADCAVMNPDTSALPFLVNLADRARFNLIQNIALGLLFSMGLLGFAIAGQLSALSVALLHNAGCLLVLINSLRFLGSRSSWRQSDRPSSTTLDHV